MSSIREVTQFLLCGVLYGHVRVCLVNSVLTLHSPVVADVAEASSVGHTSVTSVPTVMDPHTSEP